jgi:hypothetical protein
MQTYASPSTRGDPPSRAAARPTPPSNAAPVVRPTAGHALALRLAGPVDADLLHEQLRRWWQAAVRRRPGAAAVALSRVESCARSRCEREHDALRLLRLEADAGVPGESRDGLRATLVSVDAAEHLLLLAVDPDAQSAAGLPAVCSALERQYRVEPLG